MDVIKFSSPEDPIEIVVNSESAATVSLTMGLKLLLAAGCGVTAANLYYAQPLLAPMARDFHSNPAAAGAVPMACQIGYAFGLLFVTPLGDSFNRRKLLAVMLTLTIFALVATATAPTMSVLIIASLVLGCATCVPHTLIPLAVKLTPIADRGKTIGVLMSGLLLGILLSRTFSGLIGQYAHWTLVYWFAAAAILVLLVLMVVFLPHVEPNTNLDYRSLMKSAWQIAKEEPILRHAALNGAFMFGVFSIFWSSLDFLMESKAFHLGSGAAGLFGLVGVGGALAAPIIGLVADTKSPRWLVGVTTGVVGFSFVVMAFSGRSMFGLIIGAILLDVGVQGANVANQSRIYSLRESAQSRLITVFMSCYFIGGAAGSLLGSAAWAYGGWPAVTGLGVGFSVLALGCHFGLRSPQECPAVA